MGFDVLFITFLIWAAARYGVLEVISHAKGTESARHQERMARMANGRMSIPEAIAARIADRIANPKPPATPGPPGEPGSQALRNFVKGWWSDSWNAAAYRRAQAARNRQRRHDGQPPLTNGWAPPTAGGPRPGASGPRPGGTETIYDPPGTRGWGGGPRPGTVPPETPAEKTDEIPTVRDEPAANGPDPASTTPPSSGGYTPPSSGGYTPPPTGGYVPPSTGGYGSRPSSGYGYTGDDSSSSGAQYVETDDTAAPIQGTLTRMDQGMGQPGRPALTAPPRALEAAPHTSSDPASTSTEGTMPEMGSPVAAGDIYDPASALNDARGMAAIAAHLVDYFDTRIAELQGRKVSGAPLQRYIEKRDAASSMLSSANTAAQYFANHVEIANTLQSDSTLGDQHYVGLPGAARS
jgi:hypothetical protein